MTWGDESDGRDAQFKAVVLPPGAVDKPGKELLSITRSAPKVEPADAAPRNPRRILDPATGKETWNRKLRPRHRNVVRKFFDSTKQQPPQ